MIAHAWRSKFVLISSHDLIEFIFECEITRLRCRRIFQRTIIIFNFLLWIICMSERWSIKWCRLCDDDDDAHCTLNICHLGALACLGMSFSFFLSAFMPIAQQLVATCIATKNSLFLVSSKSSCDYREIKERVKIGWECWTLAAMERKWKKKNICCHRLFYSEN